MKGKILAVLLCLIAFSLLIYSCWGGVCAVPLRVSVYIQKEDGSAFTKAELNSFKYTSSPNGFITGGTVDGKLQPAQVDTAGNNFVVFQYHLGSSSCNWKIKKIQEAYKERLKDFWFKIEDGSGVYKSYEMKPLDEKKYEFVDDLPQPSIKYTIKLKKKS